MQFKGDETRPSGIDDRNMQKLYDCQNTLSEILPSKEIINLLFISRAQNDLEADLFFFTNSLLIHLPKFVSNPTDRQMQASICLFKDAITILNIDSKDGFNDEPRSLKIEITLKEDICFTFQGYGENAVRLKEILKEILMPNLKI